VDCRRLELLDRCDSFEKLRSAVVGCGFDKRADHFAILYFDDAGDWVRITNDADLKVSFASRQPSIQRGVEVLEFHVLGKLPTGAPVLPFIAEHRARLAADSPAGNPKAWSPAPQGKACSPAPHQFPCGHKFTCGRGKVLVAAGAAGVAAAAAPVAAHRGVRCDGCGMSPLLGVRYTCTVRNNFDLCSTCKAGDESGHAMTALDHPAHRAWRAAPDAHAEAAAAAAACMAEALEDAVVAQSLGDTATDAFAAELQPHGATATQLDELRLATMASLETAEAEVAAAGRAADPQWIRAMVRAADGRAADGADEEKASSDGYEKVPSDDYVVVPDEPEPDATSAASFARGAAVELHSLANTRYCGATGTVAAVADGRCLVQLDAGGTYSFKASNLKLRAPWAAELAALDDMGFLGLIGEQHAIELVEASAVANDGKCDLEKVVSDIIAKFEAA